MTEFARDENYVPVAGGVLNSDGVTPTPLEADPTSHALDIDDDTTGSDNSGNNAYRDNNYVTTLIATSESDGKTPVPLYVDSNGNLLIDSN